MTRFSGPFRVMQRPELRSETKVDGGGVRAGWCIARRKKKVRRKGGRMRGESKVLFIKTGRTSDRREKRGGRNG